MCINSGPTCNVLALRHLSIDCTEGLDPLECTARHIDMRKLVSLDIALPTGLGCSPAKLVPFLLGVSLPRAPQDHIQALLSSAEALETLIYRLPPHLTRKRASPHLPPARACSVLTPILLFCPCLGTQPRNYADFERRPRPRAIMPAPASLCDPRAPAGPLRSHARQAEAALLPRRARGGRVAVPGDGRHHARRI